MTTITIFSTISADRKFYNITTVIERKNSCTETIRLRRTTNQVIGGLDILLALKKKGKLPEDWRFVKADSVYNQAEITSFDRCHIVKTNPGLTKMMGLE